jgi:hypothetical protein
MSRLARYGFSTASAMTVTKRMGQPDIETTWRRPVGGPPPRRPGPGAHSCTRVVLTLI